MKVVMDLVINHTSDQHAWFQKSIDPQSPYHDYYFWRKGRGDRPPNNWRSVFEGGAWAFCPENGEWYLHVFSKGQPDLNMANPAVRAEIKRILRFWLEMGVDGFREDVITYIAKDEGLPNGFPLPVGTGVEHYTNRPKVKTYLAEFQDEILTQYGAFTVGESPMMTPRVAKQFIFPRKDADGAARRPLLDMVFHFQHMEADSFLTDYIYTGFSLRKLKKAWGVWQHTMQTDGWNALYLENHDHPRIISRYGSEKYRVESGKMLAAAYLLQSGTPFIYQGQEIGMTNTTLTRLDECKDVLTFNTYRLFHKFLRYSEEKFMALAGRRSRENARTPMPWSASENAGFSPVPPWFPPAPHFRSINVTDTLEDPDSLYYFYQRLLAYRKDNPLILLGDYTDHCPRHRQIFCYARGYKNQRLLLFAVFSAKPQVCRFPKGFAPQTAKLLFANYNSAALDAGRFLSRPYECRVYLWD
jgi:oligo-1,6-glucosidase